MRIHNEGKKIIPIAFFFIALLDAIIYVLLKDYLIFYLLMAGSLFLAGLVVFFFRVPERHTEKNEKHVIAPADGEIVEILKVVENEYFKEERLQISIFMSVFNVHQNRSPVSGEIIYKHHKDGVYYPAFVKKSSEKNERCSVVFKTISGTEIMSRQIAGIMARRIATYRETGEKIEQGEEYGFIRFGSRVDVFLPLDAEVNVQLKQKTVGGETVIAKLKS